MKIVVLDGKALNPGDLSYDCIREFGETAIYDETSSEEEAIRRIGDCEIVLTNKTPITERILSACPNIQYVGVQATGYNVVDCKACAEHGIPVTNVPSYGTDAVAQFTMALLLEICHQVGLHNHSVHQGDWVNSESFCYWLTPQMELAGKTIGIIGYGRIGQAVAKLAKAFGMQVLAHSRTVKKESPDCEYVSLDELFSRSHIISLHCPLTKDTQQLINEMSIRKMKDGAILINTARGGLIDEAAVVKALETGKLRYAALDVVAQEPMDANTPLLSAPNCIITPHIAWAPIESRQRLLDTVVENIRLFLDGKPQNVVNM